MHFVNEDLTLGQRIAAARRSVPGKKKLSQEGLGELIGKSRAMVGRYETDLDVPDGEILRLIADATGVSVKMLTKGLVPSKTHRNVEEVGQPKEEEFSEIPYWGTVPAGDWQLPSGDDFTYMQVERSLAKEGRISVRVAGESMRPRLEHGDLVYVQRSTVPREGVLTLAMNKDKELTLKVLRHKAGEWELQPINPDYEPVRSAQWEILGHAVAIERHLGPGRYMREVDEFGIRGVSRVDS